MNADIGLQPSQPKKSHTNMFGKIAFAVALIGLIFASVPTVMDIVSPPPPPITLKEYATDIAGSVVDRIKGVTQKADDEQAQKKREADRKRAERQRIFSTTQKISLMLATIAFFLMMFAYVKREDKRLVAASAVMCVTSFAIYTFWILIGVIVLGIIFGFIGDLFGDIGIS